MSVKIGTVLEGVVTGITKFGAFVELPGGVTGLVHISEVADAYVKDVNDYLKDRDNVQVKVINIDANGKIGLSIKQANPNYVDKNSRKPAKPKPNFEDMMSKFMKDSDERLSNLKKKMDSKRGGRGSGRS